MLDTDVEFEKRFDYKDDSEKPLMTPKIRPQQNPRRKNRFKRKRKFAQHLLTIAVILIVFGVTTVLVVVFKNITYDKDDHQHEKIKGKYHVQKILLWNSDFKLKFHNDNNSTLSCSLSDMNGSIRSCLIEIGEKSYKYLNEYNAIVFTPKDNISHNISENVSSNQVLVHAAKATLMNETVFDDLSKIPFNLTLTYRTDSDIIWNDFEVRTLDGQRIAPAQMPLWKDFNPFNKTRRRNVQLLLKTLENRTNFAMIQLCNNNTIDTLVYGELKNYIWPPTNIDVDYECKTSSAKEMPTIGNYKFVLAFENALCVDNISKLFYVALKNRVVPVVLGGPTVYTNFAPPHSYINGNNFASIRELAEYLIRLDDNPIEYVEYLWWTHFYSIQFAPSPLCELCAILQGIEPTHTHNKTSRSRNIRPYWWMKYQCDKTSPLLNA